MKTNLRLLYYSLLVCCALIFTNKSYSQINYSQGFETDEGGWSDVDFFAFYFFPCTGDQALSGEMFSDPDFGDFFPITTISPSLGTSNGLQATLTFSYSLIDWDTFEGVTNSFDWGSVTVEYSSSASGPWTNLQTISPANHIVSDNCAIKTATFTPPAGPLYFKITGTPGESDYTDVVVNIDNFSVVQATAACTGTPPASSAVADLALLCNGRAVNLSLAPAYTASGLNFQWQSSPDNINFTNVPTGGTSATYTTTQTASMWYRATITCGGGSPVTSASVHVVNTGLACPCDIAFDGAVEPISLVNFAGINNTSDAEVDGSPALEDFTMLPAGEVNTGESYTMTLEGNTNDPFENDYENYFKVFIDWNHDGDFSDANESYEIEEVLMLSEGNDGVQVSGDIAVPEDALEGLTIMRVVKNWYDETDDWDLEYAGVCADQNSGYGQAEDYLLNVSAPAGATIGWMNLQHPPTMALTVGSTGVAYTRIYADGITNGPGAGAGITAWIGISPMGSNTNPNTWTTWIPATYNTGAEGQTGNNDEYMATIGAGLAPGTYYYASRVQIDGGAYSYGGHTPGNPDGGGFWDGTTNVSGVLTVTCGTAAPVANANQTFCTGATVADLQATGTIISWYSAATGGNVLAATTPLTNGSVYYASITPAGGCESTTRTMVTVTISTVAVPSVTVVQLTCGTPTGTITVTAPVGAGYTYDANGTGFQVSATFTNLAPGTYVITAKNASNCTASTSVIITNGPVVPAAPAATIVQPTCSVPSGTITVTGPVGANLTYNIEDGPFQSSPVFNDLEPGSYTVSVQNADGCIAFTSGLVVNAAPVTPAPTGDATQEIEASTAADATIEDIQVTATGTITWYATAENAEDGENALAAGFVLTDGATYYATQTIDDCESPGFAITVDVTLGNGEFSTASFAYHPNPVKDMLTLSYDKNISGVEVYNIVGQKVIAKTIGQNQAQIDMSQLSAGTYMVKVMSDTASKTIKVVKQ
jgi:Secretion system C-terminal sorting domain/Ig-like domain CHU_C associated/GEVED domain